MDRYYLSPCVMIIALQVTERPPKKENHFAAMIAFHVHRERSQIRQVREVMKDSGCCLSFQCLTPFHKYVQLFITEYCISTGNSGVSAKVFVYKLPSFSIVIYYQVKVCENSDEGNIEYLSH